MEPISIKLIVAAKQVQREIEVGKAYAPRSIERTQAAHENNGNESHGSYLTGRMNKVVSCA